MRGIIDLGLVDTFRHFEQPEKSFSWWDYRQGAFRRNNGLRIDLILAHRQLLPRLPAAASTSSRGASNAPPTTRRSSRVSGLDTVFRPARS